MLCDATEIWKRRLWGGLRVTHIPCDCSWCTSRPAHDSHRKTRASYEPRSGGSSWKWHAGDHRSGGMSTLWLALGIAAVRSLDA